MYTRTDCVLARVRVRRQLRASPSSRVNSVVLLSFFLNMHHAI